MTSMSAPTTEPTTRGAFTRRYNHSGLIGQGKDLRLARFEADVTPAMLDDMVDERDFVDHVARLAQTDVLTASRLVECAVTARRGAGHAVSRTSTQMYRIDGERRERVGCVDLIDEATAAAVQRSVRAGLAALRRVARAADKFDDVEDGAL